MRVVVPDESVVIMDLPCHQSYSSLIRTCKALFPLLAKYGLLSIYFTYCYHRRIQLLYDHMATKQITIEGEVSDWQPQQLSALSTNQ